MSSAHLLKIFFKIAEKNQVQVIGFTDVDNDAIHLHFPVVYSLRLMSVASGTRQQIFSEREQAVIGKGFYNVDNLSEKVEKHRKLAENFGLEPESEQNAAS